MSPSNEPHLLLVFASNLLYTSKIESIAELRGYKTRLIASADQFARVGEHKNDQRVFGEPLSGKAGRLIELVTKLHPVLMIFDLENDAIPWRSWVALLKSVPATRRIPVVCFGPHVNVDQLNDALARGADAAMPRSRFLNTLSNVIDQFAKIPDQKELASECQEQLSELAIRGLELFNAGQYFEAHEVLEEAWNLDSGTGRELYRAILQIAVAYQQIERKNYSGALKMFLRSRQWIDPLPDICRGVDVAQLRIDARAIHQELISLGPNGIDVFNTNNFRPVIYSL